ncbi:MAG: hypothetical protein M9958_05910 [Chitinophagales bacterium]|nr:hypothetical protein [Chitinophagales bacterium]
MKLKHLSFLLVAVGSLLLTDCKKDKPENQTSIDQTPVTGLEFTDEETYSAIPEATGTFAGTFPSNFELPLPTPQHQGREGSCVAFAAAYGVMGFYIGKDLGNLINTDGTVNGHRVGSPEFLYNLTVNRLLGCTAGSRFVGTFLTGKGALDVLLEDGVSTWASMPYTDAGCSEKPNSTQYENARNHKIAGYERVKDFGQNNIKALLLDGYPVLIGCRVDNEFANAQRGTHIWNRTNGSDIAGNHAMVIMGYDDAKGAYKILNSWGNKWANEGYVYMAYNSAQNLIQQAYIVDPLITKPSVSIPVVQTLAVSSVTNNSVVSGGNITSNGGATITERGIVWSTAQNPTITNNVLQATSNGTGQFDMTIHGLQSNTTYYVRAYASNSAGLAYGNQVSFKTTSGGTVTNPYLNPNLSYGSITDIDGNKYATIQIGFQTWMAENLRTTKYNDGTSIPFVLDHSEWINLSTGAYTIYDYSPENEPIYGKLYNQYAVMTGKLCPKGWHIPTEEQWQQLQTYLGGQNNAGGSLKSTGTILWEYPNTGATNQSGFSALPGGYRTNISYQTGSFYDLNRYGYWWSSSWNIMYELSSDDTWFYRSNYNGENKGASCRCVKD